MENYADIKAQLTRIETAIMGDEKMGTKGIVHQQQEHSAKILSLENYKKKDENFKAKIAGGIAVGTPAAVVVWHYIVDWFKNK
jgi:hypothetical protein